jgi:probable HAF family extracellular repeat protein
LKELYMRLPSSLRRIAVCLFALALVYPVCVRRASAQFNSYSITDLGTIGGTQSRAFALNNSARVVGSSTPSGAGLSARPFAWTNGTIVDIGTFGGDGGAANGVNELGNTVGNTSTVTNTGHAFIWSSIFGKVDLGTLGGVFSAAFDINDVNQVVGQSELAALVDRGFVWQESTGMQTIPTLGGNSGAAYGINNKGQIVGSSTTSAGQTHAYLLSGGVLTDLGTFGGSSSAAYRVSDNTEVVGYASLPSNTAATVYHAFIYRPTSGMADLGTLVGGQRSIAYDVNKSGVVVGTSEVSPGVNHAFAWFPSTGMQDLNGLILTPGWTLQEARAVNDNGQIVGFGTNPSGATHAFLLTIDSDTSPPPAPPVCFVDPTVPPTILIPVATPIAPTRRPPLIKPTSPR